MFKSKIVCEITVAEKKFELYFEQDASLGALHDALVQMKGLVVEQMKKVQEAEEKKPEDKKE
jgi:hypothetical protein